MVAQKLSKLKFSEIEVALKDAAVPFGKFNTVASLLKDPHFLGRGILKEYNYGKKKYRTIVNPVLVNSSRPFAKDSPEAVGANTESVLSDILGIKAHNLERLKRERVIA